VYPSSIAEACANITVHPLKYRSYYYGIRGLPSTHFPWITLKWMPVNKVFRVTRSPPYEGFMSSSFINLKNKWHRDWNCATLEEAVDVIRQLSVRPLLSNFQE
jgi:hypothetical protein